MRKLRTLENTKPTDQRAFKRSLKHIDKYTKETVNDTLNDIQSTVESSLSNATDCSYELQANIQTRISKMVLDPSNEGVLTEAEVNKLLTPMALKLQQLHEEFLFASIGSYAPIRNLNLNKPLDPELNHQILVNWLETFNELVRRARYELEHRI